MEKAQKNNDALLLRLPAELKAELQRQADANGRRITAEINTRLRISLAARGPTLQGILAREAVAKGGITNPMSESNLVTVVHTNEKSPTSTLSSTEQAILEVFRAMPPEKQLALLSLFR